MRVFGGNVQPEVTLDESINWVAESIAQSMQLAEVHGVTVLLETHDAFSFCRGAEAARVLQQVDHPRFKVIWMSTIPSVWASQSKRLGA